MELAPLIQLVSTIVAAIIGAWIGARLGIQRFERERAFERRLDWYEQTVKALHALGVRAHEACERERFDFPDDVRQQAWEEAIKAYDSLAPLLLVSELYGLPHSIRITEKVASRMSDASTASDRAEYFSSMSHELRWAASQIAGECRDHLHLPRLSEKDLLRGQCKSENK